MGGASLRRPVIDCSGRHRAADHARQAERGERHRGGCDAADRDRALTHIAPHLEVLFGDGAGAVILSEVPTGFGILDFEQRIDGSGANSLFMSAGGSKRPATLETVKNKEHYAVQLGQEVYKSAVVAMSEYSRLMLDRNGLTSDDLKLFVPHQANSRIIEAAAKRLGIENDRIMINIDQYANTTAATIPTALHQARNAHRMEKGDYVILASFGAGYTYGSVLLKWVY